MKLISLLSTRDDTRKHEEKRGDHRDEHSRDGHEKPRHRDDRNNTPEKLNKAKELQKIKEQEKELKKERELAREKDLELARNRENSKEQDRSNSKEEPSKKPKKSRHASPHHKKRKNSAENSEQPKKRSSKDDGKKKSVYEPSDSEEDIKIDRKKIGPAIPREFLEQIQRKAENSEKDSEHYDTISSSENDEDFQIGPMPGGAHNETIELELEKRAIEMKLRQLDSSLTDEVPKNREEWMTELPEVRKVADLGLGPRQFRTKERPDFDDRTGWTDIANGSGSSKKSKSESSKKSSDHKRVLEKQIQAERDAEQEEMAKKLKKKHKRDKSLLEIHQHKLKKDSKVRIFVIDLFKSTSICRAFE
jgi:hypothetical protein